MNDERTAFQSLEREGALKIELLKGIAFVEAKSYLSTRVLTRQGMERNKYPDLSTLSSVSASQPKPRGKGWMQFQGVGLQARSKTEKGG